MNTNKSARTASSCFLPNFCSLGMVFFVVIIAQLFAFIVLLLTLDDRVNGWQKLGLVSLFIQWCALTSCALLCVLRDFIARYSDRVVASISYLVILLVVAVVSELAYRFVLPVLYTGTGHASFVFKNVIIAAIVTGPLLRYFYVQHQWRAKVHAEAESRLQALQSRIRPHFFFNSMNTIASLTRSNPSRAESAIEDLADLFRASMRDARQFHSLDEECTLCRRYTEIEKLRLDERLMITWDIDQLPGDALVPPLLIQPLLENAVYHGVETQISGGEIKISGQLIDKRIVMTISNPVSEDQKHEGGNRIAQKNIRDRLHTIYGKQGHMSIETDNQTYTVKLEWPYWKESDEDTDR